MKRFLSFFPLTFAFALCSMAQSTSQPPRPFEGHFHCKETGVNLYLNLYEETISVPGFSFLGKMNGYMNGNIYGTWMLVKHSIEGNTAHLRLSNDIGSDTQDIDFTLNPDSTYTYDAIGGNAIRRAVGRKLVKTTGHMIFERMK